MNPAAKFAVAIAVLGSLQALAAADDEESRINNEAEIRLTVEAKHEYATDICTAAMEMEYYQKGASVHVETSLDHDQCAASSGSYTLAIRYRDADGNLQNTEVEETWERADAAPVEQAKDYFVAEDVDILRVRTRKLRCKCAADPEAVATPTATD